MRHNKTIPTFLFIFISVVFAGLCKAQTNNEELSKIQADRIAYYTNQLNLTPSEAEKFWPVFNEYNAKVAKLYSEETQLINVFRNNKSEMTERDIDANIKKIFDIRRSITSLNEEYYQKFRQVLPARKVMKLIITETQFRKWLLNRRALIN
jgi:hypothetical protein